ncbi:NAC domain-containing protein JA2L-like, partial [Salvia splendens]|uniref:NAC domain-containing protein JA2L-like n=1 Tax=Salvia splendens TaxID=180675 RepID=UPI001C26D975
WESEKATRARSSVFRRDFVFFPTDEELLAQYLCRKGVKSPATTRCRLSETLISTNSIHGIFQVRLCLGRKNGISSAQETGNIPKVRGRTGSPVRATGKWKATGTDKIITTEGRKVGIKKALVFYIGKAPKGTKTNWIMHEYRLSESTTKNGSAKLDD